MSSKFSELSTMTIPMLLPDGSVQQIRLRESAMAVKLDENRSIAVVQTENLETVIMLQNKEYEGETASKVLVLKEDTAMRLWQMLTVLMAGNGLEDAEPITVTEPSNAH